MTSSYAFLDMDTGPLLKHLPIVSCMQIIEIIFDTFQPNLFALVLSHETDARVENTCMYKVWIAFAKCVRLKGLAEEY